MAVHGDCVGPIGAKLYHGTCPHVWTSQFTGREYVCECRCHRIGSPSDSRRELRLAFPKGQVAND